MTSSQIGHRIKLARKREGLSLRALSQKMDGLVSAQAIGKYERDQMVPSSRVLIALGRALGVSVDYLLAPGNTRLSSVDFRKHSRTSAKERARVEAEVLSFMERDLLLDEILGITSDTWERPFPKKSIRAPEEAEEWANEARKRWNVGFNPIPNVTELLEEKRLKVLVLELPQNVSGMTCLVQRDGCPDTPVIVINGEHSLERRRFTLLHELAHRLLEIPGDEKGSEKAANWFAGAFLMNAEHLKTVVRGDRSSFGARELLDLKRIYGVSAAALWYRIYQLEIVTKSQYEYGCRTFARGWRGKAEPEELEPKSERGRRELPNVFERKCYHALAEGRISLIKAAELLEQPISEVEVGLKGPT